jgi:LysM repeat protein
MVPSDAGVLMAARSDRGVPAAESRTTVAHAGQLAEPAEMSNRVKSSYAVKRGDTLASVARHFQTTVASVKTWNPLLPGSHLEPGQRLTVYRLTN